MNIKRAKEEIKNSIEAYLVKDEFGEYVIPTMRQRPILLLGAPGIGKSAFYFGAQLRWCQACGNGVHHE